MAVVDGEQNLVDQVGGRTLDLALVARGTEPPAFAGESEEVFVPALIAEDAGKATFEGAAVDEFLHDFCHHGAKGAVLGLVGVRVTVQEGRLVPLGGLPKR